MSKGLEALNNLVQSCFNPCDSDEVLNDKAIVEKELKALEIIKEKKVDMWHLVDLLEQTYEMYLAFCKSEKYEEDYIFTEEEFNLLKEVLEWIS